MYPYSTGQPHAKSNIQYQGRTGSESYVTNNLCDIYISNYNLFSNRNISSENFSSTASFAASGSFESG